MATINATGIDTGIASENIFLTQVGQGLTVKDVLDEILLVWGIQSAEIAPTWLLKRAIHDMNGAFQMIWSMAKDDNFFSRQTLTISFGAGVSQVSMPNTVLTILGPARFATNGQPLRPIASRSQYDSFGTIFLGQLGFGISNGTPVAFWVEKLNIALPDNVENILHIVPAPTSTTNILIDVSTLAPRYEWSDYVLATPVQMPQLYADSVLLPFCRYRAISSYVIADPDTRPTIVADYQMALKLIGAIDPQMKEIEFTERASDRAIA